MCDVLVGDSKVLEVCCQVASVQLETSSWTLSKNYTVKVNRPVSKKVTCLIYIAKCSSSHPEAVDTDGEWIHALVIFCGFPGFFLSLRLSTLK